MTFETKNSADFCFFVLLVCRQLRALADGCCRHTVSLATSKVAIAFILIANKHLPELSIRQAKNGVRKFQHRWESAPLACDFCLYFDLNGFVTEMIGSKWFNFPDPLHRDLSLPSLLTLGWRSIGELLSTFLSQGSPAYP